MVFVFNIGANQMSISKELRRTKIDEDELQVQWNVGLSDSAIAKVLTEKQGIPISQTGVSRARQRLGLAPHFEHNANPPTSKTPKEQYDDSRLRANQWKEEHPEQAKEQFATWQKENRAERNAYMRERRKEATKTTEPSLLTNLKTWFVTLWRRIKNGIHGTK